MTLGWKSVIPRPVMWERPSELHSTIERLLPSDSKWFHQRSAECAHRGVFIKNTVVFSPWLVTLGNNLAVVVTFFTQEEVWLVQALSGVRECVLSLLKISFYVKVILSDGHLWETVNPKKTVGCTCFSAHLGWAQPFLWLHISALIWTTQSTLC